MYQVQLDKFSGPLEKLLELIEERQMDITLVNLAQVTGDFLEYLKNLDENSKHPSVLADFVVVASQLLLIKSKAILPSLELTEEEEGDIKDLEARLKIYQEFSAKGKSASGEPNASGLIDVLWRRKKSSYGRELFLNLPPVFYPSKNLTIERLEKEILEQINKDKRFSFEGELIIRKEGKSTYVYDKQGNLLEKTYADGSKDVYDKQGNLLEKTYADGSKEVYDKQGNILEMTYADGSKEVYKRDQQGNLLEKTYADGSKYVYDKQGNLLEMTYADGSKEVYDKQGNLLEKTYADGSKEVYKFGIKIQIGKARTIM